MEPRFRFEFTPRHGVEVRIDPKQTARPFVLTRPLRMEIFQVGSSKPSLDITAPKGFGFDMASIPRCLWPIIPRDDRRIARAATIHDYLYTEKCLPRAMADSLFLAIMKEDGMPWTKRTSCYVAVRLFGAASWEKESML